MKIGPKYGALYVTKYVLFLPVKLYRHKRAHLEWNGIRLLG